MVKVQCDFSWQAQYLVKLECDLSWQAQHYVVFFVIQNRLQDGTSKVSEAAGAR